MQPTSLRQSQRGLSIVEMLIGIAVGMFVLGGVLTVFVDYLNNNRRLVLETRINQDLRAAADLIARDLRRAGYWGNATGAVVGTPAVSQYAEVSPTGTAASATVTYSYSQGTEDNILVPATEDFGFSLNSGVLRYLQGGSWQPITDPNIMTVTAFTVTPRQRCVPLQQYCTGASSSTCAACALDATTGCPTASCATCPFLNVRSFAIALQGTSTTDASVVRNLQETVRVRNDQLLGSCP